MRRLLTSPLTCEKDAVEKDAEAVRWPVRRPLMRRLLTSPLTCVNI